MTMVVCLKHLDVVALGAVIFATIYGAILASELALAVGMFVCLIYGYVIFSPRIGGRLGAALILPLLGLFGFVFAVDVVAYNPLLSLIVVSGAIRTGISVWRNARDEAPAPSAVNMTS